MQLLPYIPKEKNIIQTILENNYSDFEKCYNEVYAKDYGIYHLERISKSVEKFTGFRFILLTSVLIFTIIWQLGRIKKDSGL
ncbi:MAG: hypothetical protein KAT05_02110 [Spirochaetes bacterium]|nr:hypothetical protein [Spirochaetota bacterium]